MRNVISRRSPKIDPEQVLTSVPVPTFEQRELMVEVITDFIRHTRAWGPPRGDTNNWYVMDIMEAILTRRREPRRYSLRIKFFFEYLTKKYRFDHVLWQYIEHPSVQLLPIATTTDD